MRLVNLLFQIGLCALACSCKSADAFKQAESYLTHLDKQAELLKNKIIHSSSNIQIAGSKTYYVSSEGNDSWNGLSSDKPFLTLNRINFLPLSSGDIVLFRRGDIWRGHIQTHNGVTYSAYGKGDKPKIYGSPYDAAKTGKWLLTDAPNVYMYDQELSDDVGTLVFNDGECCAYKVMQRDSSIHIETGEPFNNYFDLKRDLDFYHDYKEAKRIYLCSTKGNPAGRFFSIEVLVKGNIFNIWDNPDIVKTKDVVETNNVTIDNFCIKYGGSHGIGCGKRSHIIITNCEIGWIGGSIQGYEPGNSAPVRFGNGVEIWGGNHYTVDHCYIYQVYDAGITHQYVPNGKHDPTLMSDITYTNNIVEKCTYSVESFLTQPIDTTSYQMRNVLIRNNIFRLCGFGWGYQRPDKGGAAHFKSWNHYNKAFNYVIEGNVFDRSRNHLLSMEAQRKEWLPILKKNKYIQYENASLGIYGPGKGKYYLYDRQTAEKLKNIWGEKDFKVYYVPSLVSKSDASFD